MAERREKSPLMPHMMALVIANPMSLISTTHRRHIRSVMTSGKMMRLIIVTAGQQRERKKTVNRDGMMSTETET